jgi:glycosyltransferase involved in cell wall biosynthesis
VRVLLVTDWLERRGGMETYFETLRTGLRTTGHEARLLTSTAGAAADGTAEYRAYGTTAKAPQTVLQLVNPFAAAKVRAAVREFEPDVALVGMVEQHLSPAVFSALGGTTTLLSIGDYKPICPIHSKLLPDDTHCRVPAGSVCWRGGCVGLAHWLRDRPRYRLLGAGRARVDRVLACSSWLAGALAEAGIDAEAMPLPTPPPSPGFARRPADDPLFVFVGRLNREKGVASLLRAFAEVHLEAPSSTLRLVGDGDERASLEQLAHSLGLGESVVFRGWLTQAEIDDELAAAWASVVPSLWAEPLGLVAAEAAVRGVPVVASSTGGLAEIVQHGRNGLLFPNGDAAALAVCLSDIAAGRAFQDHAVPASAVRDVAERHDVNRHVARIEEVVHEIATMRAMATPAGS